MSLTETRIWKYEVQMWEEPLLDELKTYLRCGLAPTFKSDYIQFRTEIIVKVCSSTGKVCFESVKTPSLSTVE